MKHKRSKPLTRMNATELARATAEFDKPMVIDTFRPLSSAERQAWQRATRANGKGKQKAAHVRITLEPRLLKEADALARKRGLSRSELIAQGLLHLLRKAG
jgi:hypothetical protein